MSNRDIAALVLTGAAVVRFAHWRDVPLDAWRSRWPNFLPSEIASKGDGSLVMVPLALDRLQAMRADVSRPFTLSSAYRDPIHNAREGGGIRSRHKVGDAFDIVLAGHDPARLLAAARRAGFTGFGYYATFLHVDCGRSRFWYGSKQGEKLWNGLLT